MKYKIIFSILILYIFTSCKHERFTIQNSKQSVNVDLDSTFKLLTGKLGDTQITMGISINNDQINGYYYSQEQLLPTLIEGELEKNGKLTLRSFSDEEDSSGKIICYFLNNKHIIGKYINPTLKDSVNVNLIMSSQTYAKFKFDYLERKNCKNKDNFIKQKIEPTSYWDTLCSEIKITLINFQSQDKLISEKINKEIEKRICEITFSEKELKDYESYLNTVYDDEVGFGVTINCQIINNNENVVCVRIESIINAFGSAHPMWFVDHLNFDPKTGNRINLNDIISVKDEQVLINLIDKNLKKQTGYYNGELHNGFDIKINNDFAILNRGILIQYDPYEITGYSFGAPDVFLSYSEISELLMKNGCAYRIFKQ